MRVSIIGLGLIGSSFAISLRDKGISDYIIGVDNTSENAKKALELGYINKITSLDEAISESDFTVIAIPVGAIPMAAIKVLNKIGDNHIVIDMGSTKEELCDVISMHPKRGRFVATHPMWGTENSGPQAAVKGAFEGRTLVLCQRNRSDNDAVAKVEEIYTKIGMPIKYMDADEHDMHVAYISHISHVTSFALALTVLEKEREDKNIFDLASAGFESTVRLAKSSPEMWTPIFMQNKYNVLDVLREHIHQLQILRKMIENDDVKALNAAISKANSIRKVLQK